MTKIRRDVENVSVIKRKAIVKFSDGTEMQLENVTATKTAMKRHYNKFVKAFYRGRKSVHVTEVIFL